MKKTNMLVLISIFWLFSMGLQGAVPALPLETYPGAKALAGDKYFDYHELKIKTKQETKDSSYIIGGNFWLARFKHKDVTNKREDILNFFKEQVKKKNGKEIFSSASSFYCSFDTADGKKITGHIWSNDVTHNVELVLEAKLEQKTHFGGDTPFKHAAGMKVEIPDHPVIRPYEGSIVNSNSKYFKYRDLKLRFKENGKWVNKIVKGRNWHLAFDIRDNKGKMVRHISDIAILKNLASEVERLKGKVLKFSGREIVFMFPGAKGNTWGKAWANDRGNYTVDVVDEEAFKQTLTMNIDQMKQQMDEAGSITLQGVYFDTDKATLKPGSKETLDKAFQLLNNYKNLNVEVAGHTDNTGGRNHNLELSGRRAGAVKEYLVKKGISANRLTSKGYGDGQPVASNDTEEGRAKNRRVELVKIDANKKRAVGSFDLIKPFPGSKEFGKRNVEKNGELEVFYREKSGKKIATILKGEYFKISYRIKDEAGKVVRNISRTEIKQNYINEVKRNGGEIYYEKGSELIFKLNPAAKEVTWVRMWITDNGYYTVTVLNEKN